MATTNALVIQASILHVPTDVKYSRRKVIDQTNDGQAAGRVTSTTTAQSFDLTNVVAPGSGYFVNLDAGSDKIQIGVLVTDSVGTGTQFIPFAEISPGVPQHIEFYSDVKVTTPLQYKTSSGTVKLFYSIQDQ